MKKTILMTFMLAAGAVFAEDFLYWMVDQSNAEAGQTTYLFDYATLREADSSTYLCFADANGDTGFTDILSDSDRLTTGDGAYSLVNSSYKGTYMFELWTTSAGSAPTRAAYAAVASDLLSDYIYSNMSLAGETPYTVTATQLIPEPTSGLLMLLGFAVLGLRRKRA